MDAKTQRAPSWTCRILKVFDSFRVPSPQITLLSTKTSTRSTSAPQATTVSNDASTSTPAAQRPQIPPDVFGRRVRRDQRTNDNWPDQHPDKIHAQEDILALRRVVTSVDLLPRKILALRSAAALLPSREATQEAPRILSHPLNCIGTNTARASGWSLVGWDREDMWVAHVPSLWLTRRSSM